MDASSDILDSRDAGALVFRGGLLRVAGFAAGTLLSLGGAALLTRHLGVRDYGRYQPTPPRRAAPCAHWLC